MYDVIVVHVPEPSVEETYQILLGLRERYEAHHKLRYTDEALDSAAKFSSQYISDRFLPDKVRRHVYSPPSECVCFHFVIPWLLVTGGLYVPVVLSALGAWQGPPASCCQGSVCYWGVLF